MFGVAGVGQNTRGFGFVSSLFSVSDSLLVLVVIVPVDSLSTSRLVVLSVVFSVVFSIVFSIVGSTKV